MLQSNFPPFRAPYEQRTWSRSQHFHVPPGQVVRYMWRYDFIYFSIFVSYSPGQVTLGHIKYSWVIFIICWLFQKVRHSSSRALSQAYSSDLTRCHWQMLFRFLGAMLNQMDDADVIQYVLKTFIYAVTIIISALAGFWTGLLLHRVKERRLWGDLSSRETGSSIVTIFIIITVCFTINSIATRYKSTSSVQHFHIPAPTPRMVYSRPSNR